jgi:hypothetical protein
VGITCAVVTTPGTRNVQVITKIKPLSSVSHLQKDLLACWALAATATQPPHCQAAFASSNLITFIRCL